MAENIVRIQSLPGIKRDGTGVATALGINVGTAGSFTVNGGAGAQGAIIITYTVAEVAQTGNMLMMF